MNGGRCVGQPIDRRLCDDLEDASDLAAYGSKMGIDATRKWASEGFKRPWPTRIRTTEQAAKKAEEIWARIRAGWKS